MLSIVQNQCSIKFWSATVIKFLPRDILGVSHKILWRNESAVYHLQISALVPEKYLGLKNVSNMQMRLLMMSYFKPNITSGI